MPFSLASATLPVLGQILSGLETVLTKAEAHAARRKITADTLLYARLFPDMFHFTRQVQTTCDFALKIVARLSGSPPEKLELSEKSFEDLRALVARTRAAVAAADTRLIDAAVDKDVTFPIGERSLTMPAQDYALRFAMPNFYFHATMAYAILRENGVELSKPDYMGQMTG